MSQKKGDGDVLANKVSLMQAKGQRLLASLLGTKPETEAENSSQQADNEDDDLKKAFVEPEQLGIGGIAPKDIEDGSFTKRIPTSDDKLLAQLIGNKRAKAHLASKQTTNPYGKQQNYNKPSSILKKREESEDEEEGRVAAFQSKRRKTNKSKPGPVEHDEKSRNEQEVGSERDISLPAADGDIAGETKVHEEEENIGKPKPISRRSKPKPTSFLDEILAERSKKKQKRGNKTSVES